MFIVVETENNLNIQKQENDSMVLYSIHMAISLSIELYETNH